MKPIKVSEASGAVLDWMVLKALGHDFIGFSLKYMDAYPFSADWAQGGPIIEREGGTLWSRGASGWVCKARYDSANDKEGPTAYGPTPLIAAMRCYCCSKLGDIVDVPEELCQSQKS